MLEEDIQREQNRLEATAFSDSSVRVQASIEGMIQLLKVELEQLKRDIDDHMDRHPALKRDRHLLSSIQGVGEVVSQEMVYLLNSRVFRNGRQAAAFVGLTPVHQESGTWKGRSRLSKRGPSRIRSKLYMAAVVCSQHDAQIRLHYQRLLANGKTKMQALCAAMHKLVEICFAVLKQQSEYRPWIC